MQQLLLLHGALGAKEQLADLEHLLLEDFIITRLNFSGHGGMPFTQAKFSIEIFAEEVIHFLDANNLKTVNIFGYSMGGYVGMHLTKHFPDRVNKLATLATKYQWDEVIATKEVSLMNAEKIVQKIPAFAESLSKLHAPNNWKSVMEKTAEMLTAMGKQNPLQAQDYNTIHHQVLLMLGDRDKMVTLDETLSIYKTLPNAQLAVLPNTAHPIEQVNMETLAFELKRFFT